MFILQISGNLSLVYTYLFFFVLLVQLDDFLKGLETLFVSRNVRRVCARLYLVMGKNAISIQSDCKYTRGI